MSLHTRKCSRCGRRRLIKHFGPNSHNIKKNGGYDAYCKDCRREYGIEYQRNRRADPNLKDYFRNIDLRKNFGITLDEYNALLENQGGVCAICGAACSSGNNLSVDHDHDTLQVRGLLCRPCNIGLGLFKDDVRLIKKALRYLKDAS